MRTLHLITRLTLGGPSQNTIDSVVAMERARWRPLVVAVAAGAALLSGGRWLLAPSLELYALKVPGRRTSLPTG